MSQDFSKGKIYKITNDFNDDVYIGSTCDRLVKRFAAHKLNALKEKCKNRPLYKLINEIGFERFRIQLVEDFPCNDKYELRQREGHYIRQIGTLNKKIEGRTKKEWEEENKENIKENKKEYYNNNKEVIKEKRKEFRENNREQILEHIRQYRKNNIEKFKERDKQYYKNNKEKVLERMAIKINCVCGSCIRKGDLPRHNKTKKHIKFINNNNSSDSQIE